jgi:ABC-type nitrate/sulfonate/bicarbonate transport system ATPase subunit
VPGQAVGSAVPLGAGTGAELEVRGVRKSFPTDQGSIEVLAGVDLLARPGEFVTVVGPSGCGKSTLLGILAGIEPPSAGEVLLGGEKVTGRAGRFAYMPQSDVLFDWRRVLDNATLGLEVRGMSRRDARAKVAPLIQTFGLAGFERAYPFQLSGGMRQRVALLRTVAQGQRVLLLDEPLGALDALTRREMQIWLQSVWERFRWTVVLVTHDIREAVYLSDTVYVMSPRPASIRRRVAVELPRPRTPELATSPRAAELEAELLATLGA